MIYGSLRNQTNLTRIRTREQLQKFCEHEQASTRLNFASKSSKGQILRAVENCNDHSVPLHVISFKCDRSSFSTTSVPGLFPFELGAAGEKGKALGKRLVFQSSSRLGFLLFFTF